MRIYRRIPVTMRRRVRAAVSRWAVKRHRKHKPCMMCPAPMCGHTHDRVPTRFEMWWYHGVVHWLFIWAFGRFDEYVFPQVRAVFPDLELKDVVKVQPMTGPVPDYFRLREDGEDT